MSLTSIIRTPEVRRKFTETFQSLPLALPTDITFLPPLTNHYALVGTAFDYLLRFYLMRLNRPIVVTHPWVAKSAIEVLEKHPQIFLSRGYTSDTIAHTLEEGKRIISLAKNRLSRYLRTGTIDDKLIQSALQLAQLDPIFRAGVIDPNLGKVHEKDIEDLRNLISAVKPETFRAEKICILNPTFGRGSTLVGGADCDILLDNKLIDIKTTSSPHFKPDYYFQLIGYYILSQIGGIDGSSQNIEIKEVGLYFSRHAWLYTIPVETFTNISKFRDFVKWFEDYAYHRFQRYSLFTHVPELSEEKKERIRERMKWYWPCRRTLTLFKVLRKGILFLQYKDVKNSKLYMGLVKREWNFSKGFFPSNLREKVENTLRDIYMFGSSPAVSEDRIRKSILDFFEKNVPPEVFSEFKEKLMKQDIYLSRKYVTHE